MSPRELASLEARVLPFRRRSAAVRVRRRNPWLALLGPLARAATVVVTPLALGLWLFTAPSFALGRIDVAGNRVVPTGWVEQALASFGGENLFRLPLGVVEQRIAANPWVERVTVAKRLPNRLEVELVERRPAALLRTADGLTVLDREGHIVAPWTPELGAENLLLVSVGTVGGIGLGGALDVADELRQVEPDWAATLSEVEVLSEEDFRLYIGSLPFPVAVRRGTLAQRLPALRDLLPELERRYPALGAVDLRFERRLIFQPVVERS
jgi:cell division protein FtsQ